MRVAVRFAVALLAVASAAGCAKVQVSDHQQLADGQFPRPEHIYVYDFVGTPGDVPPQSSFSGQPVAQTPQQTEQQIALNREIGGELAQALVDQIAAMGLPAQRVAGQPAFEVGDLVLRGTLLSVQVGSAEERVAIGLGQGAAALKVAIEGYEMTRNGLVEVGRGKLDTQASETPGAAVGVVTLLATKNPLGLIVSTGVKLHDEKTGSATIHGKVQQVAKEVAAQLRPRFEQQGWIVPQAN